MKEQVFESSEKKHRRKFELMDKDAPDRIHSGAKDLLWEKGVTVHDSIAKELFIQAGAFGENERVRIPSQVIDDTLGILQTTSSNIPMFDRYGNHVFDIKRGNILFGNGEDAQYMINFKGKFQESTMQYLGRFARIVDGLDNIDFLMSSILPEQNGNKKELHYTKMFAQMATNSKKPIVATNTDLQDIKGIHQTAQDITNRNLRPRNLKEKPYVIAYITPLSPLMIDKSSSDRLLYCADNDIVSLFSSGANMCSGAPCDLEGAVMQGHAEFIAGAVLGLAKNPEARLIYGPNVASLTMGMDAIIPYGGVEWARSIYVISKVAEEIGLPNWGFAGATDSALINTQAITEAYGSMAMACLCESTLNHNMGVMNGNKLANAAYLVLVNEMVPRAKAQFASIPKCNPDEIIGVIGDVMDGKEHFCGHEHTFNNFRNALWFPTEGVNRTLIESAEQYETLKRHTDEQHYMNIARELSERKTNCLEPQTRKNFNRYVNSLRLVN